MTKSISKKYRSIFDEIIKKVLVGKSYNSIAEEYNMTLPTLYNLINALNDEEYDIYNPTLYTKIQMEHSLNGYDVVDKDLLDDIITLNKEGFTYIEIAMTLGVTEDEVRKYIRLLKSKKSAFQDINTYNAVLVNQNENFASKEMEIYNKLLQLEKEGVNLKKISSTVTLNHLNKIKKIRGILCDFLASNMTVSISSLALKYGYDEDTVRAILKGKSFKDIALYFITEEDFKEIKNHFEKEHLINLEKNQQINESLYSYHLTSEERVQLEKITARASFWFQIIFTFRLTLKEFSELVRFSDLNALENAMHAVAKRVNPRYTNILDFLWRYYTPKLEKNEGKNYEAASTYLKELGKAQFLHQDEKYRELLYKINDHDYYEILRKKLIFSKLSLEEKNIVIEFCLKYLLTTREMPFTNAAIEKSCTKEQLRYLKDVYDYNLYLNRTYFLEKLRVGSQKR